MKKFYYSFTTTGTLNIWLKGYKKLPELVAEIEPACTQTKIIHTRGSGMVPLKQKELITGELPAILECLLYYQEYIYLN